MAEKIAGILGGMGPEATVDLMNRVIKATPAKDDEDHIRMVVDNNPKVPSRIKALIQGDGTSPGPCLREMARKLESWGVDFLAMPCNTAHFYHQEIQEAVSIPVLDMISLAVEAVSEQNPRTDTVGLIASTAVLNLNLYKNAFAGKSINLITPHPRLQDKLMSAIQRIKTGCYGEETYQAMQEAADNLVQSKAQVLLIACTEISIISQRIQAEVPVLDAAQILAEAIIREAGQQRAEIQ
ncbi:MAG: aspartate/glutamate racemase family protein [Desulfonatronovibrio sp.]